MCGYIAKCNFLRNYFDDKVLALTSIYSFKFYLLLFCLSKLPYEVTPEQAMSHEEVRNRLEASSLALRAATDKVLNSIVSSLDNIP